MSRYVTTSFKQNIIRKYQNICMIKLQDLEGIVDTQRGFFQSGETKELGFRLTQLRKLKEILEKNEKRIYNALHQDLGKPPMESYTGELGVLIVEINHALKHLNSWMRPRRAPTPITLFPSKSRIYQDPRGIVLIMGPWNYPFQLLLSPLVGVIAAGNCAVLKPSELALASSSLVAEMIAEAFSPEYITVIEGGREAGEGLLNQKFDYIFFTGGEKVGKIVALAAAKHLTPVTLELGGKSPCVVDKDASIDTSARRIVWGKFFNAGQTCIAPDYLLVQKSVKKELLDRMIHHIQQFFGTSPIESPDYARIVNSSHFDRLAGYLQADTIVTGGQTNRDQRYFAPTILEHVSMEDEIMKEEIFGPILPVLEYQNLNEAIEILKQRPNPLSFYLFTTNDAVQKRILKEVSFGGGCINNTLVHFTNPDLPFGGIGSSGIGAYHGQYSFETFSHRKSVVTTSLWIDLNLRYQPYLDKLKLIKKLMK
jgi:aldehyde dehydrogenase (NAD+)